MTTCSECQRCEADGCDRMAYCLSEPTVCYPCPHSRVLCDDHADECPECLALMEREAL